MPDPPMPPPPRPGPYARWPSSIHGHLTPMQEAGVDEAVIEAIDEVVICSFTECVVHGDAMPNAPAAVKAIGVRIASATPEMPPAHGFVSHDEWTPQTPFVSYSLGRWATPPVQEVQEEPAAPRLASAPPPLGPEWLCDRTERQKFEGKLGRAALAACEQDPRRPLMMLASTVAVEVDRELPPPPVRGAGVALVQGTKDYMEDRAIAVSLPGLDEDSVLAAVFDGHVGHTAAAFCATHLPAKLSAMLDGTTRSSDASFVTDAKGRSYEAALSSAFDTTNAAFLTEAPSHDASGTTACVVLKVEGALYVANCGDSRAVLCSRQHAAAAQPESETLLVEQLTTDQRPDNEEEYDRIEAAGGEVFDAGDGGGGRVVGPDNVSMLACARSIGDRLFKSTQPPLVPCTPQTSTRPLFSAEVKADELWPALTLAVTLTLTPTLTQHLTQVEASELCPALYCTPWFALIASDGVWDVLTNERACKLASDVLRRSYARGLDVVDAAARAVCDAALAAGSEDNISAVVLLLDS